MAVTRKLKRRPRAIGVLFSGGLDSAALVGYFARRGFDVWPVYVRSGLPWERNEVFWARRFLRAFREPNIRHLSYVTLRLEQAYNRNWSLTGKTPGARSRDSAVFLPARNLLLVTKALLFLSSENIFEVAIATLKGNPFPDGRNSYFRRLENLLSESFMQRVRIRAPFRDKPKSKIIRSLKGVPLSLSLSCISPRRGRHCGRCNKCAERKLAFRKAGVEDETAYER